MGKFSFFEVPTDFETDVLSGLSDSTWNGNRVNVEVSQAPGTKSSRGGRSGGRSRSGGGDRKRSNSSGGRRDRNSAGRSSGGGSSLSRRESGGSSSRKRSSEGGGSSFKGRFNAAAKRKRD